MGHTGVFADAGRLRLGEAALAYADAGLAVFPCAPGAKRPLTRHGLTDATTDRLQITRWWHRQPDANVGLATGGSGFDVVDVDCRESGTGFAALERARQAGLTAGWAMVVRTPSTGLHLYFPAQPGRSQRSWAVPQAHVDFRGTGGYVLASPSQITTSRGRAGYGVIAVGRDPQPVDGRALQSFLRPRHQELGPSGPPLVRGTFGGERIAAWLARCPEGNRNRALYWAACRYAEQDVPHGQAQDVLGVAAEQAGLPDREISATIRSAYRTAAATPAPSRPPVAISEGITR